MEIICLPSNVITYIFLSRGKFGILLEKNIQAPFALSKLYIQTLHVKNDSENMHLNVYTCSMLGLIYKVYHKIMGPHVEGTLSHTSY